jgi:hypothetical protein
MGKRSGTCDRPGISLEASDGTETESVLSGEVAGINTTLRIHRFGNQWWTKDERIFYRKRKEGWVVYSFSTPVRKAFEEYGLIHQQAGTFSYEHTCFPSLKAARQAVNDVCLEAGLSIDSRLTRGASISYKIGDLPFNIKREESYWRVYALIDEVPQVLQNHFNSTEEFNTAWESTDSALAHYPTRKAAHQAAINWLSQTITKGK